VDYGETASSSGIPKHDKRWKKDSCFEEQRHRIRKSQAKQTKRCKRRTVKQMHHIKAQILKPDDKKRDGKGFSKAEVKKAGLNSVSARKMGLPVDPRRRTVHEENVAVVKAYAEKEKAKPKPKPKPKPVQKTKKEKPKS